MLEVKALHCIQLDNLCKISFAAPAYASSRPKLLAFLAFVAGCVAMTTAATACSTYQHKPVRSITHALPAGLQKQMHGLRMIHNNPTAPTEMHKMNIKDIKIIG